MNARPMRSLASVVAVFATASMFAHPAAAKLIGGQVEHRPTTDPAAEVARLGRSAGTVWLAWAAPARETETICGLGRGGQVWGMTLDDEESNWGTRDGAPTIAVTTLEVFAALRNGRVEQLKFASEGCPVEARDSHVVWLDGVTPAASVAFLGRLAERWHDSTRTEVLAERALAGLAFHADPAAPLALVHLGRESKAEELRSQALFWLAQTGDPNSARWIREAIARDPADEVREQGVFALSQLADATPQLLALLRESADRGVKRQAIFWLGQSDDPRATAELERLLTR